MQLLTNECVQFSRKTLLILPDSSSKACKLHTAKHFCAWSQLEESGVDLALADGQKPSDPE